MNVTTTQLHEYIETFHTCLDECAATYLPAGTAGQILRSALLPARISGYVSTQFGVAIEYAKAPETSIHVVRGSARVEDLLIRAPKPHSSSGPVMFEIATSGAVFEDGILDGRFPFKLSMSTASISFKQMAFEIGSWRRFLEYAEVFGDRRATNWSAGKAESRAKDEVLATMMSILKARERALPLSQYIELFKGKMVLVLGSYSPDGLERLNAIARLLRAKGYEPVLIQDVPDHPYHDLSQKVVAIGSVSRFVMVDDSINSGHLLEVSLCKTNEWVTVLLRSGGVGASWMTAGAGIKSNVIREIAYGSTTLAETIDEAVQWAEDKVEEIRKRLDKTYPWRRDNAMSKD